MRRLSLFYFWQVSKQSGEQSGSVGWGWIFAVYQLGDPWKRTWTWNLLNLTSLPLKSWLSSRWCSATSAYSVPGWDLSLHVALLFRPPATVTSPPPDWFSLQACVAWLHIANGHGCLASPQITPKKHYHTHTNTLPYACTFRLEIKDCMIVLGWRIRHDDDAHT